MSGCADNNTKKHFWVRLENLAYTGVFYICIIAAAVIIGLGSPAWAADTQGPSDGLSAPRLSDDVDPGSNMETVALESLISYAVEHNARVKAARLKWESIKEKYPQAVAFDDPVITYTQPVSEIETRLGPQERSIALSQKIPFPGKLSLKGDIVNREIDIARTEYEKALRDLRADVKKAYFELYYIDRATELALENEAVLDYFADVSKVNYGLSVSELDELVRAQKLSAQASLDLIRLSDIRTMVASRLNTLLYRDPSYPVARTIEHGLKPFGHSLEELRAMALENYEELKIAGLRVEKSELETELAGYAYKPNFTVGVNYSQIGDPPMSVADAGRDAYGVTFGINIPIWSSKNSAAVNQADIDRQRSLVEKSAVVNELENSLKTVYFNLTNSERIARLYGEKLVPEAKESMEFAEARYRNGEEMIGRVLEAQSMWLNFRLVYYRSVADYLKAVAELERLTARELY